MIKDNPKNWREKPSNTLNEIQKARTKTLAELKAKTRPKKRSVQKFFFTSRKKFKVGME